MTAPTTSYLNITLRDGKHVRSLTMLEQRQAARINALITGIVIGGALSELAAWFTPPYRVNEADVQAQIEATAVGEWDVRYRSLRGLLHR